MASPPAAVRLQLEPPGLGPVGVQVQLRGGVVHTALAAGSAPAAAALGADGELLRAALARHSLELGSLHVGLGGGAPEGRGHGAPEGPPPLSARAPGGRHPPVGSAAPPRRRPATGRVDLIG